MRKSLEGNDRKLQHDKGGKLSGRLPAPSEVVTTISLRKIFNLVYLITNRLSFGKTILIKLVTV